MMWLYYVDQFCHDYDDSVMGQEAVIRSDKTTSKTIMTPPLSSPAENILYFYIQGHLCSIS